MLLKKFPDIHWLRKQARTNFQDKKGVNNLSLPGKGWPNVVLNTQSSGDERRDIIAPFSLFMNLSGESTVIADGREVNVGEDTFCIVNKGQSYDLLLSEKELTTTFNIHFGDQLFKETLQGEIFTTKQLLDSPEINHNINLRTFVRSRWKEKDLKWRVQRLRQFYHQQNRLVFKKDLEYELLTSVLGFAIQSTNKDVNGFNQLDSSRKSTKEELFQRLGRSVDYIHAFFWKNISLEEMSQVACLSKYHYLRTFKQAFFCSPHQYIMQLRLQKAEDLLQNTKLPMIEISQQIGFEEPNSFGRFFRKYHGCTPLNFRKRKVISL